MQSFYEIEQMVKIKQEEMCQDLCNRSSIIKQNDHTPLLEKIRSFFHPSTALQNEVCCMDQVCCAN
jgi:hypothetical protein